MKKIIITLIALVATNSFALDNYNGKTEEIGVAKTLASDTIIPMSIENFCIDGDSLVGKRPVMVNNYVGTNENGYLETSIVDYEDTRFKITKKVERRDYCRNQKEDRGCKTKKVNFKYQLSGKAQVIQYNNEGSRYIVRAVRNWAVKQCN